MHPGLPLTAPGVEDEEPLRRLAGLPSVPREQWVVRREGDTSGGSVHGEGAGLATEN